MALRGFQVRSISLPSRLHTLKSTKIECQLQKLKSWHNPSSLSPTAPVTSETVQSGLLSLAGLCNSLSEIDTTKQSLEDSLENSIELIDSCNAIKETILMIRDNVQSLQSALRRKGCLDADIQHHISSYLCFRKKMHKSVQKSVKKLKNLKHSNADGNFWKFLTGYAVALFSSVLELLSRPVTKQGSWSLVSRLMLAKSSASARENSAGNEMGRVDFAVRSLQGRIRDKSVTGFDVQLVQKGLKNLDDAMEGIEIGLERSFRSLVEIRVKLLNILTDRL
ncbi:uncharacterized protein LOC127265203 [Andrographis paniculata]|uniref:uncharacterized protein LOC127265203 n=1 Tax=Andrographis paniculata TaxID=175694 RepID=UPI0021E6EA43|nr:uncharacterized protein LOC127265203 [Andrographis paniculata]